jgi:hypothetical protein
MASFKCGLLSPAEKKCLLDGWRKEYGAVYTL